jgi:hypothetical protein
MKLAYARCTAPLGEERLCQRIRQVNDHNAQSKFKARTNETPEFLTYYVAQQSPILYNRKVVVLPRFQFSFCSKSHVNLGFCHPSKKKTD